MSTAVTFFKNYSRAENMTTNNVTEVNLWDDNSAKIIVLLVYYVICFFAGQYVNWLCLLNLHKTKLTQSARYLMTTQCSMNTCYISLNFPYKAAVLFLQKKFLPLPIEIFCGWLHIFVIFGSMFLQVIIY